MRRHRLLYCRRGLFGCGHLISGGRRALLTLTLGLTLKLTLTLALTSDPVAFFKEAAELGDLYVSVGNDACITQVAATSPASRPLPTRRPADAPYPARLHRTARSV